MSCTERMDMNKVEVKLKMAKFDFYSVYELFQDLHEPLNYQIIFKIREKFPQL